MSFILYLIRLKKSRSAFMTLLVKNILSFMVSQPPDLNFKSGGQPLSLLKVKLNKKSYFLNSLFKIIKKINMLLFVYDKKE